MTVLVHPDPRRVGERAALPELWSGSEVRLSRSEPAFAATGRSGGLPLGEPLSAQPIHLAPAAEGDAVMIDGRRPGVALEVDGRPLHGMLRSTAEDLTRGVVLLLNEQVALLLHLMSLTPSTESVPSSLVGESLATTCLKEKIRQAAALNVAVLLRGETGTGKELAARAIHDLGPRRDQLFVAINMAAIPPTLAASELFGAARGAYTGADRKKTGFFRQAHGGTLFLDEIGDTPAEVQGLLLRALESGEIQPVGSAQTERVDVRLITATDVAIESEVAGKRFRGPFYYRLAEYLIHLPALRERRDDVGRLLRHFLKEELNGETGDGTWPSAGIMARLARYDWPGNVRELRNVSRRLAVALLSGEALEPLVEDLLTPFGASQVRPPPPSAVVVPASVVVPSSVVARPKEVFKRRRFRKMSDVGEAEIRVALKTHAWRVKPAAAALGVSRATLYRLMEACPDVRKASELGREEIEEVLQRCADDLAAAAAELEVSTEGLRSRVKALDME